MKNFTNFNWKDYINRYDDLCRIPSKELAWRHYKRFGEKENRIANFSDNGADSNIKISKQFFVKNFTIYITRHVNSPVTSNYWVHSYHSIRFLYPNINIHIIDDNSNQEFIKDDGNFKDITFHYINENNMKDYIGRGELLPFIIFNNNPETKYALFIHDSIFIHKPIHDLLYEDDFYSFWSFKSLCWYRELYSKTITFLSKFKNNSQLNSIYKSYDMWEGTFGGICVVSSPYIELLNKKYNFINVCIENIKCRNDRMVLERILSILYFDLRKESPKTIFSDIHSWSLINLKKIWNLSWKDYMTNEKFYKNIPIIKVWSGR